MQGKLTKRRFRILVKAYPEASKRYEETVCCAGISEDGKELVRLYPIRYRRLPREHQFDRFDLVEMEVQRNTTDFRPESYHVSEGSIRVLKKGSQVSALSKARFWQPFVASSLPELERQQRDSGRSLGIIKAPVELLEFYWKKAGEPKEEDPINLSLIEDPLKPFVHPEHTFRYRFVSGGKKYTRKITDWEVYAAWHNYKRRYGPQALDMIHQVYNERMPEQNLHFILGTVKSHPHMFIIIGLLRTTEDLGRLATAPQLPL